MGLICAGMALAPKTSRAPLITLAWQARNHEASDEVINKFNALTRGPITTRITAGLYVIAKDTF